MKWIALLVINMSVFQLSYSQKYLTADIIEKAEIYLKESVGDSAFQYFKLDPDSYYEYKTRKGKTKWDNILKHKQTKGSFSCGKSIRFLINHPDFQYLFINKRINVNLDSNLNLISEINISKVPRFILENRKSDWLTENQLDSLIKMENLKKSIKPITKRLEFDLQTNQYRWIVFNTLYEKDYLSDEEILIIHPISGNIIKHYEERQYITR